MGLGCFGAIWPFAWERQFVLASVSKLSGSLIDSRCLHCSCFLVAHHVDSLNFAHPFVVSGYQPTSSRLYGKLWSRCGAIILLTLA